MKRIGITGGIGAGKSIITDYLQKRCHCKILQADILAWELEDKGGPCYGKLISLLGDGILSEDGRIDKKIMGAMTFMDPKMTAKVNAIVHPVVKEAAEQEALKAQQEGYEYFFFEAALMFESGCDEILDEVWYIYAPKKERIKRLMKDRGYSRGKALSIMSRQLDYRAFAKKADRIIRNDADVEEVYRQIDKLLT